VGARMSGRVSERTHMRARVRFKRSGVDRTQVQF
jgi:hypothetical protein